jgi:molybdenum-dependent DNA-binding transcriptional regulator ModE
VALSLLTAVQLTDVRELVRGGAAGPSAALEALCARLIKELNQLSETLTRAYFSHSPQSRQLAAP